MKLLKRSLVLLGCALAAAAAFTACELGLGGDDRLETSQGSGTGTGSGSGLTKKDENDISYYALETNAAKQSDLSDKFKVIDCDAAGDADVHDNYNASRAKIVWENPLNGKTLSSGATFVFDIYSDAGANFDAVITVCKAAANGSPEAFEALALFEGAGVRYIKADGTDGVYDNFQTNVAFVDVPDPAITKTWTKVAVVLGTNGSVSVYRNGVLSTNTTIGGNTGTNEYTWAVMNTFLTSSADSIGIDLGFSGWASGYLADRTYLSEDIRVYPTALTAEQVARISVSGDGDEPSDTPEEDDEISCSEKFKDAELKSTYTMTIAEDAKDSLGWYLYPQFGTWSYVVDDGTGETQVKSVAGVDDWWKGTAANKTSSYVVGDGKTLTFYTWISAAGTMILEGSSSAGAATINPYDTDNGGGDSVSAWKENETRKAISPDGAQSIKIEISRSGNTQIAKFYTL